MPIQTFYNNGFLSYHFSRRIMEILCLKYPCLNEATFNIQTRNEAEDVCHVTNLKATVTVEEGDEEDTFPDKEGRIQ